MKTGEEMQSAIAGWLSLTSGIDVPLALSRNDAGSRASELRKALNACEIPCLQFPVDEEGKDVLWALVHSLGGDGEADEIACAVRVVEQAYWDSDELGERGELLSRLAYLGWKAARERGEPVAAQGWFTRLDEIFFDACPPTSLTVESIADRLPDLCAEDIENLTSDPFLLFSLCVVLRRKANAHMHEMAVALPNLYRRVSSRIQKWSTLDREYPLGSLALVAAHSNRNVGLRSASESWLKTANESFTKLRNPVELLAEVWLCELSLRLESGESDYVLDSIGNLREGFQRLDARRNSTIADILHGCALRMKGRISEAVGVLSRAQASVDAHHLDLLPFLLLVLADLFVISGDYGQAEQVIQNCTTSAARHRQVYVLLTANVVAAEMKRDRGDLSGAAQLIISAVDESMAVGLEVQAARARLILGEILITLDEIAHAERELRVAWKTFREQRMAAEGLATLALLREIASRRGNVSVHRRRDDA